MTEDELMDILLDAPSCGLPCAMADGRTALLILNPTAGSQNRDFGFQVPGEEDVRWRSPEAIMRMGNGALAEVPQ